MEHNRTSSTEKILKEDVKELPNGDHRVIEVEKECSKKLPALIWLQNNASFITSCVIFTILTGYFAWATYFYTKNTGYGLELFNATTCMGYGFLVILYGLYVYGFLYSYVIKPFVLPTINKELWTPTTTFLGNIRYGSIIFYVSFIIAALAYLVLDTKDNRSRLIPISGLCIFLIIGYICSANRSMIQWRVVIWGIILQFIFGLLTIRWKIGRNILQCFGDKVNIFLSYAFQGASFTYGNNLIYEQGVFAFKALSTIYFISFMVNILYYYGIMQRIIGAIGDFLQWVMGTSICESVNSAANIFLGQSEAPLLLGPYLKDLTDSEIHSVMTSGFATVSGSVMAAYITYGARPEDLITSSIMSAPAALCFSKLMYPETEEVRVKKENINAVKVQYDSVLDAASKGATDALNIVLGIVSSVIAFLAFIYFINGALGWFGGLVGYVNEEEIWTLEAIIGKLFIPISYVMGVPWKECESVGTLIGLKTMVNEFVAFERMHTMMERNLLSARTKVIATYAICGFSNPGSVGIMISAMGALMPNKREVVTRLVFRAFFGGALVCFMTACIATTLMPEDAIA